METIAILSVSIVFAILCFGLLGSVWMFIVNERTYRQRRHIVECIFAAPDWVGLHSDFERVTYNDHLWALAKFKNPLNLYGTRIRRAVEAAGAIVAARKGVKS